MQDVRLIIRNIVKDNYLLSNGRFEMLLTEKKLRSMICEQMAINEVKRILSSMAKEERQRLDENALKMLLFKAFLGLGLNNAEASDYAQTAMQSQDTIEQIQDVAQDGNLEKSDAVKIKNQIDSFQTDDLDYASSSSTQTGSDGKITDRSVERSDSSGYDVSSEFTTANGNRAAGWSVTKPDGTRYSFGVDGQTKTKVFELTSKNGKIKSFDGEKAQRMKEKAIKDLTKTPEGRKAMSDAQNLSKQLGLQK